MFIHSYRGLATPLSWSLILPFKVCPGVRIAPPQGRWRAVRSPWRPTHRVCRYPGRFRGGSARTRGARSRAVAQSAKDSRQSRPYYIPVARRPQRQQSASAGTVGCERPYAWPPAALSCAARRASRPGRPCLPPATDGWRRRVRRRVRVCTWEREGVGKHAGKHAGKHVGRNGETRRLLVSTQRRRQQLIKKRRSVEPMATVPLTLLF